jgi:hypothetical protein
VHYVSAALAQLVEQFIRNEKVASSIPASGTNVSDNPRRFLLAGIFLCGRGT